jgi:hypothetical protein
MVLVEAEPKDKEDMMKKIILITITILLSISMMACPTRINTAPSFVRMTEDADEGEFITMRSLTTETLERDKAAFETAEDAKLAEDPDYEVKEFDPFEYYGDQYIIYGHPQGENLVPDDVVDNLVENTGLKAIDYKQDYVEIGRNREYYDLSDEIILTSFYLIWLDGDDANYDGEVNEEDEQYYGQYMTDEEGNYIYETGRMKRKRVGDITEVAFYVEDEEGLPMTIRGLIIIV